MSLAVQGQKSLMNRTNGYSYEEFIDILTQIAEVSYDKPANQNKYKGPLDRMSALLVHIEMSAGRRKHNLKLDPWWDLQTDTV